MKTINKPNILTLHKPNKALPVIFDSPHSGTIYPDDFNYSCDLKSLRSVEDSYVDELFAAAPDHGAIFLNALFPRSYIDVNRAANDIDTNLLAQSWPYDEYGEITPTVRSDSGIGLISRIIKPGTTIYNRHLSATEIMNRIKDYYEPYHDTLCTALDQAYYDYGQVWHINCHSMPSTSAYTKYKKTIVGGQEKPSDIVLGDRDGQSCGREFLYSLREFWQNLGYRVSINDPFKGVELISRYAQPTRGRHSIQIEINRSLYMDETTGERSSDFNIIKNQCSEMTNFCTSLMQRKLTRLAAD